LDIFKNTGDFSLLQGHFASLQGCFAILQGCKAFLQGCNLTFKPLKNRIRGADLSIQFYDWLRLKVQGFAIK